ncbi:hypothetical protein TNCV_1543031 [Trichonephila clavipes]|nr:hypothetical protein TNCV_1543031 [Trichonephila clavipes]
MSCEKHRASFGQVFVFDRGRIVACRIACILDYPSEKLVSVLDETKQIPCGSVIAGCRKKQGTKGADRTNLVAPLPMMTGGLCAW